MSEPIFHKGMWGRKIFALLFTIFMIYGMISLIWGLFQ